MHYFVLVFTSCTSCTSCTGTAVVRTGCSSPVGSSCPERGHRKAPQCNAGQRTKRKNAQNGETKHIALTCTVILQVDDNDSTSKVSRGTLFLSYQSLLKKRSNHFSPFASLSTFALLYFIVCVCIFQFLYLSISMFVYAFFNVCICVFQCRAECSGDKVGSPGASSCPPLSLLIV